MRRWLRTLPVLVMALLLVGCAKRLEQQADRLGLNKRVETVGARVDTGEGILTIFHYTQLRLMEGRFCGEGYSFQGIGGSGQQPCGTMGALTLSGQTHGNLAVLFGRVNDPKITKVMVTLEDGRNLPATIGDGVWYLLLPDSAKLPRVTRLEGLDDGGNSLYSIPLAPF